VGEKLFIGGLAWNTEESAFTNYFAAFGELTDSVVMRGRGFGFVTYKDPAAAEKVLASKDLELDGRKLDPKRAVPKDAAPAKEEKPTAFETKKIFVGGLASETTKEEYDQYFGKFGTVTDSIIMSERGESRGFGFVTFDSEDAVEKVMAIADEHMIHNKRVECKRAIPRDANPPPPRRGGRDRFRPRSRGGDRYSREDRFDRYGGRDRDRGRYDDYYGDYDRRRGGPPPRYDGYDRSRDYDYDRYYDDYSRAPSYGSYAAGAAAPYADGYGAARSTSYAPPSSQPAYSSYSQQPAPAAAAPSYNSAGGPYAAWRR